MFRDRGIVDRETLGRSPALLQGSRMTDDEHVNPDRKREWRPIEGYHTDYTQETVGGIAFGAAANIPRRDIRGIQFSSFETP